MKPGNPSAYEQPKVLPKGRKFSQTNKAPKIKLPPFPGGKANPQGNTP